MPVRVLRRGGSVAPPFPSTQRPDPDPPFPLLSSHSQSPPPPLILPFLSLPFHPSSSGVFTSLLGSRAAFYSTLSPSYFFPSRSLRQIRMEELHVDEPEARSGWFGVGNEGRGSLRIKWGGTVEGSEGEGVTGDGIAIEFMESMRSLHEAILHLCQRRACIIFSLFFLSSSDL